jgi:hypothetical protein
MVSTIQYRVVVELQGLRRGRISAAGKWTKKTPDSQGVGRFFLGEEVALAERLDDQGAYRDERDAYGDRGNRRDRYLLLPPAGGHAG